MGTWHRMAIGDGITAVEPLYALEQALHTHRRAFGDHAGRSIYIGRESDRHLHCEVVAYFPPQLADLARQVGASPCAPPDMSRLDPLIDGSKMP